MFPSLVFLIARHGASCIDFVLTFRMYVQLGIPEYILISFAVGMYNVVLV
jgi:hypothetical protein